MSQHQQTVQQQFDPQAQAYLTSKVHAEGPDLALARDRVAQVLAPDAQALDIGCGAGHLSFTLAPLVARMVAYDPSASMLDTVSRHAAERGLPQIETRQGLAEKLPFPDASFQLVATRYSAHHWMQLESALCEMRRVLQPGGWLLLIDVEGHATPLVDTHLQAMELLRDRSHVRNHSAQAWSQMLADHGFTLLEHQHWPLRLEFTSWVERMRTSALRIEMLRALQTECPQEVRDALSIEADGSFKLRTGLFWAQG
jgi:ubiquinone/menaquinone biosynthesis C-methylase UbiE